MSGMLEMNVNNSSSLKIQVINNKPWKDTEKKTKDAEGWLDEWDEYRNKASSSYDGGVR